MITFQNKGLIDLTALTTFGVSVKETEDPIGFFGTGLKYAISIILRNGGAISVYRGLELLEFTSKTENVRGKDFQVICMNGQSLGFTTHMGVNWKPWQAYRELHCNTQDEGGEVLDGNIPPLDGYTTIHVKGLDEEYAERDKIILRSPVKALFDCAQVTVYPMPSNHVYMRNVRVDDLIKQSRFTYNFNTRLTLTEDRSLKYSRYDIGQQLGNALLSSDDENFIERFVSADKEYFEHDVNLSYASVRPTESFLAVVKRLRKTFAKHMNQSALEIYLGHCSDDIEVMPTTLNSIQVKQLEKARGFLSKIGHNIDLNTVTVCEDLGEDVLGRALVPQKRILLAVRCFDMGTKYVAGTLLEEHLHITKKFEDCTRTFQNYLFDQLMTLGERIVGEPI